MAKNIFDIIIPIQEQTGLEIDIFTEFGERIASTHNTNELYVFDMTMARLQDEGIVLDKKNNITYFCVNLPSGNFIGVITGANNVSKNYAFMVAKLLETQLNSVNKELNKQDFIVELLLGNLKDHRAAALKEAYHLADTSFYVINVSTKPKDQIEVLEFLQELLPEPNITAPMQNGNIAVLKTCGEDDDYQSAGDFGANIYDNIEQELSKKVNVGVGGIAKDYTLLPVIYSQSVAAVRLGRLIEEHSHVFSYKDYLFIKLFEEIPLEKSKQYLDMSLDKTAQEVLKDKELMDTAEQFLNNSLNISETARIMYMHRNTLLYRLDKIEKLTGLNLRRFSDAVVFRSLNILYKLSKGETK